MSSVQSLSRVRLLVTPWTAAYQAPPSMGFSRQEYWSGVPLPSPISVATFSICAHPGLICNLDSFSFILFMSCGFCFLHITILTDFQVSIASSQLKSYCSFLCSLPLSASPPSFSPSLHPTPPLFFPSFLPSFFSPILVSCCYCQALFLMLGDTMVNKKVSLGTDFPMALDIK